MSDKTFVQKLDALQNNVTHFLCTEFFNISSTKEDSDYFPYKPILEFSTHYQCQVLKIKKENLQFTLDGNRFLSEFDGNELIDNQGYKYKLNVLSIDQLCIFADAINKREF